MKIGATQSKQVGSSNNETLSLQTQIALLAKKCTAILAPTNAGKATLSEKEESLSFKDDHYSQISKC